MSEATHVEMPMRMRSRPIDPKWNLPIPWFVAKVNGKYEFPVADAGKWRQAVRYKLCWCCGKPMAPVMAFVIGPMCGINCTSSEPPNDVNCAIYAAKACPFLSRPKMKRMDVSEFREHGASDPGGIHLNRNPGCCAVWITKRYEVFESGTGPLIQIGYPQQVLWFAEGREATRDEVQHSIETGLPFLEELANGEGPAALAELDRRIKELERWLPK